MALVMEGMFLAAIYGLLVYGGRRNPIDRVAE
jgi:hypothetical protein